VGRHGPDGGGPNEADRALDISEREREPEIGARLRVMTQLVTGHANAVIARRPSEVFAAVADITKMGEWSPETTACRWIDGGQALGAKFEGDNEATLGPISLKKWTTVSEVTAYDEARVFEFVAEASTTWRFEFADEGDGTKVTESFSYPQASGFQRILYNAMGSRRKAMIRGMEKTLSRLKAALEA
jgi:hypothetical protein